MTEASLSTVAANGKGQARKGLAIFLAVVIAISGTVQGVMIASGKPISELFLWVIPLMWSPTIAMVVARLALREGFGDVSFRLGLRAGGWREWLLAWLYPVALGSVAYGIGWLSGLAPFTTPNGKLSHLPPVLALASSVGVMLTLGTLISAITATGEELGWRGYMLTRLIDAGVPRPLLVSGIIWAMWHLPLILTGQYAAGPHRLLSAALFFVGITAAGYAFARVRLVSGSVWPAVLFHSAWNAVIQGSFDRFTGGHDAAHAGNIWVGESGILVATTNVLFAVALLWRPIKLKRFPADDDAPSAGLATL